MFHVFTHDCRVSCFFGTSVDARCAPTWEGFTDGEPAILVRYADGLVRVEAMSDVQVGERRYQHGPLCPGTLVCDLGCEAHHETGDVL